MMTSSNISSHNLLDPLLTGHSTIQLVSPTDEDLRDGGHFCHDWVSHHHHQQAGSDDRILKHDKMDIENGIGSWVWEQKDDHHGTAAGDDFDSDDHTQENWVPSKLKVVKKMNPKRASTANSVPVIDINTDDFPYSNDSISNGSSNNGIRVCSDCNTTKTPLWRSGPKGPKSLCNACGIRQRKARRALAAASAAAGSDNAVTKPTTSPKSLKVRSSNTKENKTSTTKRLKPAESSSTSTAQDADDQCNNNGRKSDREICFEEFMTINLSKNSALQRVFPQDEKEAAILLMALSCGLVHHHHT